MSLTSNHAGVLQQLIAGTWREPGTGKRVELGLQDLQIRQSLDGAEADLVSSQHAGQSLVVVSDPGSHAALGDRVYKALKSAGLEVREYVWQEPECSESGVEHLRAATRGREALIAVGSGTVSDSVKYASFLDDRTYSVFATSPMNAYTTATASVSFGGFKRSISCRGARGVYIDLDVLINCPKRLISAAFADVICRTTAQVDWLLSHLLFGTGYVETPYTLLAMDEPDMLARADAMLHGDPEVMGMLARNCSIMGLGTGFTQTTHSGSMAEHMISHYIDMFAGAAHPGSSHGEQVGIATLTMSHLQNRILNSTEPPQLQATRVPEAQLYECYGAEIASNMIEQTAHKALDAAAASALSQRLDRDWELIRQRLTPVMLSYETLLDAMQRAGCPTSASELGLAPEFYHQAVRHARYVRDRYSMLDLIDDSIGLEACMAEIPV